MYDFFVIGGDMRQAYLADILRGQGYRVCDYLLPADSREKKLDAKKEESEGKKESAGSLLFELMQETRPAEQSHVLSLLQESKTVLAPIPLSKEGSLLNHMNTKTELTLDFIAEHMTEDQYFFAGCIPKWFIGRCEQRSVCCYDYMRDEPLAVRNAVATAEGILAEAILKYPGNLHDTECLVLGFGKCGRVLAEKLKGLSAKVTVCIRKDSDYAWAKAGGYEAVYFDEIPVHPFSRSCSVSKEADICCQTIKEEIRQCAAGTYHLLSGCICEFPLIFNTVPNVVLDRGLLSRVQKGGMIFDIASAPGGVDFEVAQRLGIAASLYPSLPGKYAPKASAEVMAELIKRIIRKE